MYNEKMRFFFCVVDLPDKPNVAQFIIGARQVTVVGVVCIIRPIRCQLRSCLRLNARFQLRMQCSFSSTTAVFGSLIPSFFLIVSSYCYLQSKSDFFRAARKAEKLSTVAML